MAVFNIGDMYDATVALRRLMRKGIGIAPRPRPGNTAVEDQLAAFETQIAALESSFAASGTVTRTRTDTVAVRESVTVALA